MFDERLTPPDDPAHENPEDDGMGCPDNGDFNRRDYDDQRQHGGYENISPRRPTTPAAAVVVFKGTAGELAAWCNAASDNALVDALGIIKHAMDIRLASASERRNTLSPVFNQLAFILALPPENADDIAF